ncbi:hypothetical protein GTZ78_01425 [Streptomyces sp. SID8361]|uniref:hypothetical protein n=1 Tax=Streptomyces sp. MnatMP-M27 TaxID=1839768 RepID=UPI00114C9574|nr:hypothetical protein [Streptomyces sp. MnatMP-M27]MYU09380.1 hypothetical protein [Streptomyces sp. SID8361]
MPDRFSVAAAPQSATCDDVNIPRPGSSETRIMSARTVTAQASAFLAMPVLLVILISSSWTAPATSSLVALLLATRKSYCRYLRIRLN